MIYLVVKAVISALIIVAISEIGKRSPGFAALVASLPLISVIGMIWLWRDTQDAERLAAHSFATFWYVIPSLPMFLLIPLLVGRGWHFLVALGAGAILTIGLYLTMTVLLSRFGVEL